MNLHSLIDSVIIFPAPKSRRALVFPIAFPDLPSEIIVPMDGPDAKRQCPSTEESLRVSTPSDVSIRVLIEEQQEDAGNGTTYMIEGLKAERLIRSLANCESPHLPHETLDYAIELVLALVDDQQTLCVGGSLFQEYCSHTEEAKDGEKDASLDNFLHSAKSADGEGFALALVENKRSKMSAYLSPMPTVLLRSTPPWA